MPWPRRSGILLSARGANLLHQNDSNGELDMNTKLEAGKEATAAVQDYVRQALEVLQGDAGTRNADGVLHRPHDYRRALLAAAGQLNAAAALIERTTWPSRKDYDEAGL
jgi:hypothetical protein